MKPHIRKLRIKQLSVSIIETEINFHIQALPDNLLKKRRCIDKAQRSSRYDSRLHENPPFLYGIGNGKISYSFSRDG